MNQSGEKLKITERGWAGHFCAASSCLFRRNTLIEYGERKWVVSTVGNYNYKGKPEEIGAGSRYYETMAFDAMYDAPYWEADVTEQIDFDSNWALDYCDNISDKFANEMHEEVVKELSYKITI